MAVSKVILNGTTLIDTTDKTVTSGGMLSGVTALKNDGTSITGSIASQAAQTIHPSTSDQTIASGKYLTGAQTVKGVLVTNLSAGNIKKDVVVKVGDSTDDDCVASVTGTYEGSGGGGVTPAPQKQINFIDYDGTILYSYTKAEIEAMTSESDLPANPSHDGLTAQGWNWTLAQLKTQLTAMPNVTVWVGQMYVTSSGKTEIDITFKDSARLSPILTIAVNGTVTVDWGDGTNADTVTGTSLGTRQGPSHTYSTVGDYTITVTVSSGSSFRFYGSTSHPLLRKNTTASQNKVYANCVRAVRFGSGVTDVGAYSFCYCASLEYVTIPNTITRIGNYAFNYCYKLNSITIPSGVATIPIYSFSYCTALSSISIPSSVTSIEQSAFEYNYALASLTIPSGVTSIGASVFQYSPALASLTIPSGVTSIGGSAFIACYGVKEYHILPTSVPTGGSSMFANIVSDCIIYVPTAKLSDYQGASNWSTYASYMQGE